MRARLAEMPRSSSGHGSEVSTGKRMRRADGVARVKVIIP